MPTIRPFRALHFDPAKVPLDKVVTQPYDRIDPALQTAYYDRHPNNAVRLLLGREPDRYEESKRSLAEWLAAKTLVVDPAPALYLYSQEYTVGGEKRVRRGITAMVRLQDYGKGTIFPHEHTQTKPKEDRMRLLTTARTHFGHVFLVYHDPARTATLALEAHAQRPPDLEARDDYGFVHRVWRVTDAKALSRATKDLDRRPAFIADGHHRYETALEFCRRQGPGRGDKPHDYVMATLVNPADGGVTILPTHRAFAGLPSWNVAGFLARAAEVFDLLPYGEDERSRREFEEDLRFEGFRAPAFGFVAAGLAGLRLLSLRDPPAKRKLDVNVLHETVLGGLLGVGLADLQAERFVRYPKTLDECLALVRGGGAEVAFLLNPVRVEQIQEVVAAGERFPPKTTDFHPKLLSGLLMGSLDRWM